MAGVRGSGAGGEPDVVGVVTAGGEDLLAVDHILVAVTDSGGAQRREVGAGFGLGVTDGEVDLTGEDRGQELLLLLVGAVHLQGRADGLQRDTGQRHVGADGLVGEDLLFDVAETVTAEFDGPADAQPAVLAHAADHVTVGGSVPLGPHDLGLVGRDQVGEVAAQFVLQCTLVFGQFDEHRAPTRSSRYEAPPSSRAMSLAVDEYLCIG